MKKNLAVLFLLLTLATVASTPGFAGPIAHYCQLHPKARWYPGLVVFETWDYLFCGRWL